MLGGRSLHVKSARQPSRHRRQAGPNHLIDDSGAEARGLLRSQRRQPAQPLRRIQKHPLSLTLTSAIPAKNGRLVAGTLRNADGLMQLAQQSGELHCPLA